MILMPHYQCDTCRQGTGTWEFCGGSLWKFFFSWFPIFFFKLSGKHSHYQRVKKMEMVVEFEENRKYKIVIWETRRLS